MERDNQIATARDRNVPGFAEAAQTPEVADQLGVLDGSLDLLGQAVDALAQRLSPIMHDTVPSASDTVTAEEPPNRSMIGGRIRGARERVADQTRRIEALTWRLEV